MNNNAGTSNSIVLAYLDLRKYIGYIGLALPFVLVFGNMPIKGLVIEKSISSYYHTVMGGVFVGSLCAIAVFLITYRGYEIRDRFVKHDNTVSNFGGFCAIGVALLPTTPELGPSSIEKLIGGLHLLFAFLFFLTLAYFCLILFKMTGPNDERSLEKKQRDKVYTFCGRTILVCIGLIILVLNLPDDNFLLKCQPVFVLETLAIIAFGFSWFVKGQAILKDVETNSAV